MSKYEVIRVFPQGWTHNNLQTLENILNRGYEILRVDTVQRTKNGNTDTFNDYILIKKEE